MEVSVQKTEIASKFTGIRAQVNNDYLTATSNALKDFYGSLQTLSLQGLAGRSAIATAERGALKDFVDGVTSARKDSAKALTDGIKEMQTAIGQKRKNESDRSDGLWDRLYKHYQVFGGNNPQMEDALKAEMTKSGIDTSKIPSGIANASEVANYMRDASKAKAGRPLTTTFTKEFSEIDEGLSLLNDFEQRIQSGDFDSFLGSDARGPIEGRLGSLNPWSATKRFMTSSKVIKQIIGKALEGGVLRKEDEQKYQHIIPNETDSNPVLNEKFDNLRKILKSSRAIKINNLRRSGYDVSEYSDVDPLYMDEHNLTDTDAQRIMEGVSSGNFEGGDYLSLLTAAGARITQSFDTPVSSRENGGLYDQSTVTAWGSRHRGVDVAMNVGTPIPAPSDLTVKKVSGSSDSKSGWGLNIVAVDSKGREYRFSHLSMAEVTAGQKIPQGRILALSGNSGNSTGPHLDFRVRMNGNYIDPYTLTS